ncbi:MAG TPA: SDR family oxidoreductase [Thermopetrobacter sp.]|nr:SDR family oxidoreductase [Thermopetrobacter sp.]
MQRFTGRTVIVTGGARGIGRACAERFAAEGANVVIADIDEDAGEEAAPAIAEATGSRVLFRYCDVTSRLDARNAVNTAVDEFGALDFLVSNAGIVHAADFLDLKEEDFERVLAVNLGGAFLMGQTAARQMVAQVEAGHPPGAIVNMSSVNAVLAIANQVPYTVSKGGLNQLTRVMALALAPYGIRVNAIGPGSIMTDMLAAVATDEEARRKVLSRTPLGRIGEPDEVAAIAAFLCSEDASYVTGQCIYADGGRLPLNYTVATRD